MKVYSLKKNKHLGRVTRLLRITSWLDKDYSGLKRAEQVALHYATPEEE